MSSTEPKPDAKLDKPAVREPKVVSTKDILDGRREVYIEHDGEMYRLRITRRNRLILQK